jgi:hypothetical protein
VIEVVLAFVVVALVSSLALDLLPFLPPSSLPLLHIIFVAVSSRDRFSHIENLYIFSMNHPCFSLSNGALLVQRKRLLHFEVLDKFIDAGFRSTAYFRLVILRFPLSPLSLCWCELDRFRSREQFSNWNQACTAVAVCNYGDMHPPFFS